MRKNKNITNIKYRREYDDEIEFNNQIFKMYIFKSSIDNSTLNCELLNLNYSMN